MHSKILYFSSGCTCITRRSISRLQRYCTFSSSKCTAKVWFIHLNLIIFKAKHQNHIMTFFMFKNFRWRLTTSFKRIFSSYFTKYLNKFDIRYCWCDGGMVWILFRLISYLLGNMKDMISKSFSFIASILSLVFRINIHEE